jgi:hypothetical protein
LIDVKAKRRNIAISFLVGILFWLFAFTDAVGSSSSSGEKLFAGTLVFLFVVFPAFFVTLFILQFATWLISRNRRDGEH